MKHELTVTLRPLLYSKTPQQQFEITKPFMEQALLGFKHTTIAELTGEHNIHYHSVIEVGDLLDKDKLLNRFRPFNKYLGRKTCTAVQYEQSYENYIRKDYLKTAKIIPDPVIRDDYRLFYRNVILDKLNNLDEKPILQQELYDYLIKDIF